MLAPYAVELGLSLWQVVPQLMCSHWSGAAARPVPSSPTIRLVSVGAGVMSCSATSSGSVRPDAPGETERDLLEAEDVLRAGRDGTGRTRRAWGCGRCRRPCPRACRRRPTRSRRCRRRSRRTSCATQKPVCTFWNRRVSTRLPSRLNSFQTLVPTGKTHSFGSVASIFVPGGSEIHRCFVAKSAQRGTAGA